MRYILVFAAVLAGCTTAPAPRLPDGKNRVVDIVNTTDAPLQFYAVNAERRGAFAVRNFANEVAANYYLGINFVDNSGACLYDLHAELASGAEVVSARFDTCKAASWVVAP